MIARPLLLLLSLSACAAVETGIAKRELHIQTQMTDTIFMEPVGVNRRTVYVEVNNTSDRADFDLEGAVIEAVTRNGYQVLADPNAVQYRLQANILQAGRTSQTAAERAYKSGFGSILTGGAIGAGLGYGAGKAGGADALVTAGGVLVGATAATIADAFVQDVRLAAIVDIQLSERTTGSTIVTVSETRRNPQGSTGEIFETSTRTHHWKRHRTRIVAQANRVNLDWQDAAPAMARGIAGSIAGLF